MDPSPNNLAPCVHQPSLLGGAENMKLLFDSTMALILQGITDNQNNARRRASNEASFDHLVNMSAAAVGLTGATENQQSVSPIRTAAADTETQQPAGAVYPPIRNVDQGAASATNVVQTALAAVAAQIAALQDVVSKLSDALIPVVVTAAGGASTPSQTTPKA